MAIKRYDVVAVTGKYTDQQGNEKKRYTNCGVIFETDKGLSLKLETLPVGSDGWFQLYEPRDNNQSAGQQRHQQQKSNGDAPQDFEDSEPF